MKEKFMKFMNHQITVKDTIIYMIIVMPIIGAMIGYEYLRDHSAKLESDDDIDNVIE
jgi:hypothetical protein